MADVDEHIEPADRSRPSRLWIGLTGLDAALVTLAWSLVLVQGWRLVGDDAFIMLRAHDVIGPHTPLKGMPSSFSSWSGVADPHHPGPTPFWLLAPATWFLGQTELAALATTWVVVVGCAALNIRIAQRLAGRSGAIGALVLTVALQCAVVAGPIWAPLTPILAAVELLTLCFITWAIAAGHQRWWPLWAAIGTLVVHADLSYAVTVGALGVVTVAATARRIRSIPPRRRFRVLRRPAAWITAAALIAGWTPLAIDAIRNDRGGNLGELWRAGTSDVETAGATRSMFALGHALSGRWYLPYAPAAAHVVASIVAVVLGGRAWRARRASDASWSPLAAAAVVALLASAVSQAATPAAAGLQALYLLPVTVTACFTWFALTHDMHRFRTTRGLGVVLACLVPWAVIIMAVVTAVSEFRGRSSARTAVTDGSRQRRFAVFIVGVVMLNSSVEILTTAAEPETTYLGWTFDAVDPVTRQLVDRLPPGRYRWFPLDRPDAASFAAGVALGALDHDIDLRVSAPLAKFYGDGRREDGSESGTIYFGFSLRPPTPGSELLVRHRLVRRDRATDEIGRRAAASAVRRSPVRFPTRSAAEFVGTVIASFGSGEPRPRAWTDPVIRELGDRYWKSPDLVKDLPDVTIAALLDQELIAAPPGWTAPDEGLGTEAVVSVWFDPGD